MSIRQECIDNLVNDGMLTRQSAETLPTVDELRLAYLACIQELVGEGIKEATALQIETSSITNIDRTRGSQLPNMATYNFALCHYLTQQIHELVEPMSEQGRDIYSDNIRDLLNKRAGHSQPNNIVDGADLIAESGGHHRNFNADEIFQRLPEKTRAPLKI